MNKLSNKNEFIISCISCIVIILVMCYFTFSSSASGILKGTSAGPTAIEECTACPNGYNLDTSTCMCIKAASSSTSNPTMTEEGCVGNNCNEEDDDSGSDSSPSSTCTTSSDCSCSLTQTPVCSNNKCSCQDDPAIPSCTYTSEQKNACESDYRRECRKTSNGCYEPTGSCLSGYVEDPDDPTYCYMSSTCIGGQLNKDGTICICDSGYTLFGNTCIDTTMCAGGAYTDSDTGECKICPNGYSATYGTIGKEKDVCYKTNTDPDNPTSNPTGSTPTSTPSSSNPTNSSSVSSSSKTSSSSNSNSSISSSSTNTNSSNSSSSNETVTNPQTGEIAIFAIWVIAFGAICYSFWYFRKVKEN